MKPIYKPTGKALEYAELALNIYNGCPHGCVYCYARGIARKTAAEFQQYRTREKLLSSLYKQLQGADIRGKLVHLCFTCDPLPYGRDDHEIALVIIDLIHDAGANVQVLTKGAPGDEVILELKAGDKFGVTATCFDAREFEPHAAPTEARLDCIARAKAAGIDTFLSCEPVLDMGFIEALIKYREDVDEFRIGKLNYNAGLEIKLRARGFLDRSWGQFGRDVEALCKAHGRGYLIKESLRAEMGRIEK